MSYKVVITDNITGKTVCYHQNVEAIMGSMVIRHDDIRNHVENFAHSHNRTLCGGAFMGIKHLAQSAPEEMPWLIEATKKAEKCSADTCEEMERMIANDLD